MKVKYTFSGCFGSEVSELTVYDMQDSTTAILKTLGQKTIQVTLTAEHHSILKTFLQEFKQLPDEKCYSTSKEDYVLIYLDSSGQKTLTKNADCLNWDGYRRLKKFFFNDQP